METLAGASRVEGPVWGELSFCSCSCEVKLKSLTCGGLSESSRLGRCDDGRSSSSCRSGSIIDVDVGLSGLPAGFFSLAWSLYRTEGTRD